MASPSSPPLVPARSPLQPLPSSFGLVQKSSSPSSPPRSQNHDPNLPLPQLSLPSKAAPHPPTSRPSSPTPPSSQAPDSLSPGDTPSVPQLTWKSVVAAGLGSSATELVQEVEEQIDTLPALQEQPTTSVPTSTQPPLNAESTTGLSDPKVLIQKDLEGHSGSGCLGIQVALTSTQVSEDSPQEGMQYPVLQCIQRGTPAVN
ncbi:hypothetical protein K2173_012767 [Erythroxylum novogranatense]|uniref:Uncharacterized protein n=1 Tax=Erythroxylum novogranatense TaxID=1862640 RepID=A0AAV8UCH0_9ROSI|nr:hypothetical protein K2173_012767 [Erythroxylum novogranatense]